MYAAYESPNTLEEALALKAKHGAAARLVAGATDLLLEIERGGRRAPDGSPPRLIDISRIPDLDTIEVRDGWIHLGPMVTHNQCVASVDIGNHAFPLARACWEVGAPQIRNCGTVVGNVVTASPANDTIAPLLAMNATVTLRSVEKGMRTLPLERFITGFRTVDLADDEMVTQISIPALTERHDGCFIKLGLRRAQAVSVVNAAVVVEREGNEQDAPLKSVAIALGCVAPVVVRAPAAEEWLVGKHLEPTTIAAAARLAVAAASPIDDIRASASYRRAMVETLVARALRQIAAGATRAGWPASPVLLQGAQANRSRTNAGRSMNQATDVNGEPVRLHGQSTLLDSLRAAGYTGVKEGCAEGECGACTVHLDGLAVMACLVPAERAAGCKVVTIEGLGSPERLHPVQRAIAESGGVQCGYCTPGFLMSAAKLLEERPHPTRSEAQEALTGNFCRCTGYRKILDAVVAAGETNARVE
jgi:carbon-monoxide dehydrogenase medium subunit